MSEEWLNDASKFPDEVMSYLRNIVVQAIEELNEKIGTEIAFGDEAGIGLQTHSGKTWGKIGKAPKVAVTGKRGGYNLLSAVTSAGVLCFSIQDGKIASERYIVSLRHSAYQIYCIKNVLIFVNKTIQGSTTDGWISSLFP